MQITYTKLLIVTSLAAGITGCQTYQPMTLSHEEVLQNVEAVYQQQREKLTSVEKPDFSFFAEIMSESNPELMVLKKEYEGSDAVASISTPWPNPSVEGGITKAFNLEDAVTNKTQPFVGIGFTIPLGGKLSKIDDVNTASAELKRVELVAKHRSLYMQFRQVYASYLLAREELTVCRSTAETSKALSENSRNLASLGTIGRLDVLDTQFDLKEIELKHLELRRQYSAIAQKFATLTGTSMDAVKKAVGSIPAISTLTIPGTEELRAKLGENNPDLAVRRAEFAVADTQLKLELSKQYPDISLGSEGEKEPGEKTKLLSFSLGFDLPIFDRNQQGIAEADNARTTVATQYHADVHTIIGELKRLSESFNNAKQQITTLSEQTTISTQRLTTAKQSLSAGVLDMNDFLDMQKEHDLLMLDQIEKKREFWETLFELETTVGLPLIVLEGETFNAETFDYVKQDNK